MKARMQANCHPARRTTRAGWLLLRILTCCALLQVASMIPACSKAPPPPAALAAASSVASTTNSAPPSPPGRGATSASRAAASPPVPTAVPATAELREVTWRWDDTPLGPMRVVIEIPANADERHKLPVLIAMHGRGEARKGPDKGARGWVDDYWLPKAIGRLVAPPLTRRDLLGFANERRLRRINRLLDESPYAGLIVACPYTPDSLRDDQLWENGELLASFLVDELLPRIRRETPALDATGVDGVSLGGRAALVVGLTRPEAFEVIGAVQAAFDAEDAPDLARRAERATSKNPKLRIRLLTSERDYYLEANRAISKAMTNAGVKNKLTVVPGPHAYEFNRGPGVYEMLLLHDRVLRGLPVP